MNIAPFRDGTRVIHLPHYCAWFDFETLGSAGFKIGRIVQAPNFDPDADETSATRIPFGHFEIHCPCLGSSMTRVRVILPGADDLAGDNWEYRSRWCKGFLDAVFDALELTTAETYYAAHFCFPSKSAMTVLPAF
jgi:hypothetical protein